MSSSLKETMQTMDAHYRSYGVEGRFGFDLYDKGLYQVRYQQVVRLIRKHQPAEQGLVLDLGCATGRLLAQLQGAYPNAQLMGSDIAGVALGYAKEHLPSATFAQCGWPHLPLPAASLDGLSIQEVLGHLPEAMRPEALAQSRVILKPGGWLCIGIKYRDKPGGLQPQSFLTLVEAAFEVVDRIPYQMWLSELLSDALSRSLDRAMQRNLRLAGWQQQAGGDLAQVTGKKRLFLQLISTPPMSWLFALLRGACNLWQVIIRGLILSPLPYRLLRTVEGLLSPLLKPRGEILFCRRRQES
uniref:Methyltransferase domain-containing protein n=1 Tax=Magnetococcus massalia (strain MO-1) TaxID=451514 RepID=A0A1S7LMD0_MAGMO|nr:Protein of unknown function, putative methyltransferase [Candidatus Magnetococcus massalia]